MTEIIQSSCWPQWNKLIINNRGKLGKLQIFGNYTHAPKLPVGQKQSKREISKYFEMEWKWKTQHIDTYGMQIKWCLEGIL